MNDRLWIFQVEFYDSTRRLEKFMSRHWISETLAGAIKYAESVVEHTDWRLWRMLQLYQWQLTIYLGGRGKIRPRYQYLRGKQPNSVKQGPAEDL